MKVYGAKGINWKILLAAVLRRDYGISPLPPIRKTAEGKPFFPSLPGVQFSVSHSRDLVLAALSDRPVGVDLEHIRSRRADLPRYALTDPEYIEYQRLGADWPAFYTLWTRREAWCKYTGQGLAKLWGQAPAGESLYLGSYADPDWRAAVCGEENPPTKIFWMEGIE